MRSRLILGVVATVAMSAALPLVARAQDRATQSDAFADGLIPGDYLRVSGGIASGVHPQGSLRDWNRGQNLNVNWETWDAASSGVGRVGFGLQIDYSQLPLNEAQFLSDFSAGPLGRATSTSGSTARIYELGVNTRFRIPSPFIMPSISVGFGFLDWRPGEIQYTATGGSGSVKQQHRSGAAFSIGGALDKTVMDRWAIFGEAVYTYGYTSFGQGLATPGGTCASNGCDVLKNTTIGKVRGGLRVRTGR